MLRVETSYPIANSWNVGNIPNQGQSVLSREDAKIYMHLLRTDDPLLQEISRILAVYQSGIFQLSNGQKINAMKLRILGGTKERIEVFKEKISSKKPTETTKIEVPTGKYFVKFEVSCEGEQKDLDLIEYRAWYNSNNSTERQIDTKNLERKGEAGIKGGFNAEVPGVTPGLNLGGSLGGNGGLNVKDERFHEQSRSNQTIFFELKAKKKLLKAKDPVEVTVYLWVDDLPQEREEGKPLEIIVSGKGLTAKKGSVILKAGGSNASKDTVDRTTKIAAEGINIIAEKDVKVTASPLIEATKEQLERDVDLGTLNAEIDRIIEEIKKLKDEEKEIEKNFKQEDPLAERQRKKLEKITEKIDLLEIRKDEYKKQKVALLKKGEKKKAGK